MSGFFRFEILYKFLGNTSRYLPLTPIARTTDIVCATAIARAILAIYNFQMQQLLGSMFYTHQIDKHIGQPAGGNGNDLQISIYVE